VLAFPCSVRVGPTKPNRSPRRLSISWLAGVSGPDRIAKPLHGEFAILRLQVAPALDFGLVAVLWEPLEIFLGRLSGGRALPCELLADEGVSGHAAIKAQAGSAGPAIMASPRTILSDEPSSFVNIELYQTFASHFQQELLPRVRRRAMSDLGSLVVRRAAIIRIDAAFRLSIRAAAA
jgi:hypothetical protein